MAAYALALGANNLQVGILAALPFITQVAQLPAILAIERYRRRKAIGIPALFAAQLLWVPIGAVPFLLDTPGATAVAVVIGLMAVRGAGYGAVQGAVEAGKDPAIATTHALEGAREAARELGVTDGEAAGLLAKGALDAAKASGDEVLTAVQQAVPTESM